MSLPEVLLWQRLRGASGGIKFRRQYVIGPYIVDFYASLARLVVEIDGAVHDGKHARDATRDAFLRQNGYVVVHVAAVDVLRDPDAAAASIVALAASPLHRPADGPPPRAGEDR